MSEEKNTAANVGRAFVKAGAFVGRNVMSAIDKVDLDVRRHLLQLPLLSYSLFVSRKNDIEVGIDDGYPPLVFVHGLGGNRGNFLPMSLSLALRGRRRSYKVHFESNQTTEQMAESLAAFIEQVKEVTGHSQVEMICHSLGGIVGRLAILDYDLADSVKTFISLGSPHHGAMLARFGNTEKINDLRPDSELMKRINAAKWPESVRGVCFWSRNDVIVWPENSAEIDGCESVDASPFTHYSYLVDPVSWKMVANVLEENAKDV